MACWNIGWGVIRMKEGITDYMCMLIYSTARDPKAIKHAIAFSTTKHDLLKNFSAQTKA